MMIQLSASREQFVRSLVQGGRFASEAEVIDEALHVLEQKVLKSASEKDRVESLLLEGLNSGPSSPMTSDDWDEVEREGQRLIDARKTLKDR
jgi:putative addiction module CopG family antidote